ncbi:MAG TPA: hypothetical protein VGG39_21055 [Polyangiaceae bacterium]
MFDTTDHANLLDSLKAGQTWVVLAVAFGVGFIGGTAHWVTRLGTPGDAGPKAPLWAEGLIGAVAAVAILFVLRPSDGVALVASSLVAGYAGRMVMSALEDKAKAIVAQNELSKMQQVAVESQARATVAVADVRSVVSAVSRTREVRGAGVAAEGNAPALDALIRSMREKYGDGAEPPVADPPKPRATRGPASEP